MRGSPARRPPGRRDAMIPGPEQSAVTINLDRPIAEPMTLAERVAKRGQKARHGKLMQRRRHRGKWPGCLHALAARADGASWAEIAALLSTLLIIRAAPRGTACRVPETLSFHPACRRGSGARRWPALVALVEGVTASQCIAPGCGRTARGRPPSNQRRPCSGPSRAAPCGSLSGLRGIWSLTRVRNGPVAHVRASGRPCNGGGCAFGFGPARPARGLRKLAQRPCAAPGGERDRILAEARKGKGERGTAVEADRDALGPQPEAPPLTDRTVSEPTVEGLTRLFALWQSGVALFSDEGNPCWGSHAMRSDNRQKTRAALHSLWMGDCIRRTRAGEGHLTLCGRRLSGHQTVQPGIAHGFMADPPATDPGFPARFPCGTASSAQGDVIISEKPRGCRAYPRNIHPLLADTPPVRRPRAAAPAPSCGPPAGTWAVSTSRKSASARARAA